MYEVIVVSSYQNTEAKTLEEKVDQFSKYSQFLKSKSYERWS
jgi:hypothetical protein